MTYSPFAMKVFVIDIAVLVGSRDLWRSVADQWPVSLAYFVGFSTIGATWLAHTAITDYVNQANAISFV
jgi:uncharacterized membrane protein